MNIALKKIITLNKYKYPIKHKNELHNSQNSI